MIASATVSATTKARPTTPTVRAASLTVQAAQVEHAAARRHAPAPIATALTALATTETDTEKETEGMTTGTETGTEAGTGVALRHGVDIRRVEKRTTTAPQDHQLVRQDMLDRHEGNESERQCQQSEVAMFHRQIVVAPAHHQQNERDWYLHEHAVGGKLSQYSNIGIYPRVFS